MATGLPDFYRGVDIAYQALSQMIVRPKYGGGLHVLGSEEVAAETSTELVTIAGKGMIYGGSVWLDYVSTQANSEARLTVDGQTLNLLSFLRMKEYGMVKPGSGVVSLNWYDPINYIYGVGISFGITFETSLELLYLEAHSTTPTVHYSLVYALI